MQKSFWIVVLPLFLILLFGVSSACSSDSDIRNSVVSKFENIFKSVMAPKTVARGTKRLLKECAAESHQSTERIEQRRTQCNRVFFRGDKCDRVRSERWKMVSHPQIAESSNQCQDMNAFEHHEKRFRGDNQNHGPTINEDPFTIPKETHHDETDGNQGRVEQVCNNATASENLLPGRNSDGNNAGSLGESSHSFGQALYQKSKQGSIVTYEDSGDNIYTCDHCNASFWCGEALKKSSLNAPLIYTNCCKKGQIKLEQPKPTPAFLEHLLNPNNGSESKIFRENIRVYNSMFAFTSMGATIDRKINTGSGPYVFKINGQVHHLMGSVLPSNGESPKYVQLYIYDTKNEVSNRINAIDPTHVNENIKSDIVKRLIEMFDENNELVKEFRTMRDKFENHSVPVLNMTMLDRRPTDSKQYEAPITEEIGGLIVGDIGEHNSNKDLIIQSNDGHLQRISKIHPKYMSLQYPILFPYGEMDINQICQCNQLQEIVAKKEKEYLCELILRIKFKIGAMK